jgi:hypothetical protein
MMKQAKGPQFIRFFKPVIEVLKETGGSGTAAEVIDRPVLGTAYLFPRTNDPLTVCSPSAALRENQGHETDCFAAAQPRRSAG